MKTVLITGATAGIGKATAYRFAREKFRLILTGRRKERLEEISEELKNRFSADVHILPFDVRVKKEVEESIDNLPEEWRHIDILVNNAGLAAGLDPVGQASTDD
jgi:NADP-dependent 3-hydroxy acid dehydrogenase YdfG